MTRNRWFIMFLLAALTVVFTVQAARTWLRPLPAEVVADTEGKTARALLPPTVNQRKPPMSAYDVIATRSLFDPNRTEGEIETGLGSVKQAESSRYAKRVGLYGVVINDGEKMALVNKDLGRRGKEDFIWVRVGDLIERVKVVGIERDRIYLQENGSRYEILLSDQRHPDKRPREVKDLGPTVISTGVEKDKAAEPSPKPLRVRVKNNTETPPKGD